MYPHYKTGGTEIVNKNNYIPRRKQQGKDRNILTYPRATLYKRNKNLKKWKIKVKTIHNHTINADPDQIDPAQGSSQSNPSAQERGDPSNNHESSY